MAIPEIPDIRVLMEAGMHFGHSSGKWHPKMKEYIYATRDKLHIINLEKTRVKLKEVLQILEDRIREGKSVVLVGTKKQVSDRIKEIGQANNISYVNVRWLGGTMTNFAEVQKSINRMKKTEAFLESPEAEGMIKKERVRMEADLQRMHYKFGGLRAMSKKPDCLFIIDPSHEHNAVKEGIHEGIELFAIVDTNSNPDLVDHVIPANDDAPKSLAMLLDLIEKTIQSGQKLSTQHKEEDAARAAEDKDLKEETVAVAEAEEPKEETAEEAEVEPEPEKAEEKKPAAKAKVSPPKDKKLKS